MFENADDLMRQLCAASQKRTGQAEFTSQEFLRRVAQQNQSVYVQLLERCRVHFPDWIFNKAHECIGRELARRAERAGYKKSEAGQTETDIFGNKQVE